jgi:hypothetical protein
MAEEELDALLARMPQIAEAVNAFSSETVQQEAFSALVEAFAGGTRSTKRKAAGASDLSSDTHTVSEVLPPVETPPAAGRSNGKSVPGKRRGGGGKSFKLVRDLDLKPAGKKSFAEFAAEKMPRSNEDKYAVVIYYFEQVLGMSGIGVDHVGTVFRLTPDWREPGDLHAGLKMAASRKGTINTANYSDLRTTPHGRNFVEHDLPSKKSK